MLNIKDNKISEKNIKYLFVKLFQLSVSSLKWVSLVTQRQRISLSMQGTWAQSWGQEDPLEKEMAIHSSILAGKSHGGLQSIGHKESDTTQQLNNSNNILLNRMQKLTMKGKNDQFDYIQCFCSSRNNMSKMTTHKSGRRCNNNIPRK